MGKVLDEVRRELQETLETATQLNQAFKKRIENEEILRRMDQVLVEFGGSGRAHPDDKQVEPQTVVGPQEDSQGHFK